MSDNLKAHVQSVLTTFGSTFLLCMAVAVASPNFVFSQDALFSLVISASIAGVRQVAKLIIVFYQSNVA